MIDFRRINTLLRAIWLVSASLKQFPCYLILDCFCKITKTMRLLPLALIKAKKFLSAGIIQRILRFYDWNFLKLQMIKYLFKTSVTVCLGKFLKKNRISHRRCSVRKGVLRNFAKFTGKHLCQSLFFKKETLSQVLSCEFCEISKNIFSTEHLWMTASERRRMHERTIVKRSELNL